MKYYLSFFFFFGVQILFAQTDTDVYTQVDQMPYFKGCEAYEVGSDAKRACSNQALVAYLANHLIYPPEAKEQGLEGTVYVSFIIDENGYLNNPSLLRDIGGECGQAALNVIQSMPQWEAGVLEGKKVKVKLNLPIQFSLKSQEADYSDNYTLFWGPIKGEKISKKVLMENLKTPLLIRDQFGNTIPIDELSFAYQWKKKFKSAKSRGGIDRALQKIVKRLRAGSLFSITAVIQEDGNFIEVNRVFEITK